MSVLQSARVDLEETQSASDVEIVIPVHNEAEQLAASISTLRAYLDASFPFVTTITIADNASTDRTAQIARDLAATLPRVDFLHLDRKGRGRAMRAAWSKSSASVVSYMDVDLATGLDALLPLVAPLMSGHSDLAIGTRLAPGAHVVRGTQRELISRGYNLLLRSTLRSGCTDAQCGFKAIRREAAAELLPLIEDDEWFFDTELLVTAQRIGLRIHEVPVDWVDDTDSRVDVLHTALMDLRGIWRLLGPAARKRSRLRPAGAPSASWSCGNSSLPISIQSPDVDVPFNPATGHVGIGAGSHSEVFADELLRFAGVGAISTLAYLGLFAALEPAVGSYLANAIALGLCTVGNMAAHRGLAGSARLALDRWRRSSTAVALLGVSLAFTTGALAVTRAAGLTSLLPQLAAVTVASIAAAVVRFGILRTWVFRPEFGTRLASVSDAPTAPIETIELTDSARTPS